VSRALVDLVVSRLEAQVSTKRTVYSLAVPSQPVARYLVVWAPVGADESLDLADTQSLRSADVTVTSVSRNTKPEEAAREALAGLEFAHAALLGWRPSLGRSAWKPEPVSSQPPRRDDDLPDTTFYAVEQWRFRYQP
jgi:hypothetical protein